MTPLPLLPNLKGNSQAPLLYIIINIFFYSFYFRCNMSIIYLVYHFKSSRTRGMRVAKLGDMIRKRYIVVLLLELGLPSARSKVVGYLSQIAVLFLRKLSHSLFVLPA